MAEIKIASVRDLLDVTARYNEQWHCWYYRGHNNPAHKLVPKLGREPYASKVTDEKKMFEKWKRHAVAYVAPGPSNLSSWDWLAIAQHHGLATRLLDWTFNALAATFFAVVDSGGGVDERYDSVVYAHYSRSSFMDTNDRKDPFKLNGIYRVSPSSVTPRIGRQGGIFTLHGPPILDLESNLRKGDKLDRLVIDRSLKRDIAIQLSHCGVNNLSLFPDLDGLSAHINWTFTHLSYRGEGSRSQV